MRRCVLLAALGLALLGAPALAQHPAGHAGGGVQQAVSISYDHVTPAQIEVVTGDTVMWTNDSVRTHTVTADDLAFDSGRLVPQDTFERRFDVAGDVPYHCKLHPFIQGTVSVHDLLLAAPPGAASPRRPFVLQGRASSALGPGSPLTLEADGGSGFAPVATATLAPDGTFRASVVPTQTATYRAVAGALASPPVELLVLDRSISVSTRRTAGRRVAVRAHVTPASPGTDVVLQLYLPEHFGWWPVQRGRLDRSSSASFTVSTKRRLMARVVLTLPDGATRLAVSRTVHVGPPG